jgi:hypothetical protein
MDDFLQKKGSAFLPSHQELIRRPIGLFYGAYAQLCATDAQ